MEKETIYWLEQAVLDFTTNVWVPSLMTPALTNSEAKSVTYSYLDYRIVVNPPAADRIIVSLELQTPSDPVVAALYYFVEYPDQPPQVFHWNPQTAVDLIEYVSEFWKQGLFIELS